MIHPTQFLAHVYCGQTAGWMKTPLGTEIDLGLGHIVLDGDPGPSPQKGGGHNSSPRFSAHVYCSQTVAHLSNRALIMAALCNRGAIIFFAL